MRPRIEGGETSDTYMGESSETPPTAMPPRNRAQMKSVKLGAAAVATEVSANSTATHTSMRLRPRRSVSRPAASAPSTQPNRSELNAHPKLMSLSAKCRVKNGPAPVIMAISNPKSTPPSAAVHARKIT